MIRYCHYALLSNNRSQILHDASNELLNTPNFFIDLQCNDGYFVVGNFSVTRDNTCLWLIPSHFQQIKVSIMSVSIVLSRCSIFPVVYMDACPHWTCHDQQKCADAYSRHTPIHDPKPNTTDAMTMYLRWRRSWYDLGRSRYAHADRLTFWIRSIGRYLSRPYKKIYVPTTADP